MKHNLTSREQFAYQNNSSCTTALLTLTDKWKWAVDKKQINIAAFLDLKKAFGIINHKILLSKLKVAGIEGHSGLWLENYLLDRKQFVTLNGAQSETLTLDYGVPQASVLGLTLFSIHYNEIVKSFKNGDASPFADDTEIHTAHSEVEVAAQLLNSDLKDINDWLSNNEMVVHPVKSEAMKIGTKQALKKAGGTEIKLNDHKLKEVSYCKYFGVFVDSSLNWSPHTDHICKRTYPKLKLLNRLFCFLCSDVLIKIYKATILPILDYACIVWTSKDLDSIQL